MKNEYTELSKFYYLGNEAYQNEYRRRFTSDEAVITDCMIYGRPAFYVMCPEVLSLLDDISKLDRDIEAYRINDNELQWHMAGIMADEIVMTNLIEGIACTREDAFNAICYSESMPRFGGLAGKYIWISTGKAMPVASCHDIRSIYDTALYSDILAEDPARIPDGTLFRKEKVFITDAEGNTIHEGVFPEGRIVEQMESALDFLNSNISDPICRAAVFHYLFEYIHPFYDGNGRLGRLILSNSLVEVLSPLIACSITAAIANDFRGAYHKAFMKCGHPLNMGDMTPFLIMMLKMIKAAAEKQAAEIPGLAEE